MAPLSFNLSSLATIFALFAVATPQASANEAGNPSGEKKPAKNYHFGVQTHFVGYWDPATIMPLVDATGVGWIRDEIYPNQMTETSPGVYNIQPHERAWIDLAASLGLKINLIFNDGAPTQGDRKALYQDPAAYARAAAFIAKEFKGKVQAIEVLNEPNGNFLQCYGGVWNGKNADGTTQDWVKKYVELLNATAEAVKAVNPEMKVIGLDLVAPANHRALQEGLSPKVDGIVDHPYSFPTVPEIIPNASNDDVIKRDGFATADAEGSLVSLVEMYRAESLRNKGPKEIWFTEWGYSTYLEGIGTSQSRISHSGFDPLYLPVTEHAQACYTLRRYVESLAIGVEVSFLYDFKNDGTDPYSAEHNFGIVDFALKPKPAYFALQNLSHLTSEFTPSHTVNVKVFPFSDDRQDPRPVTWDGAVVLRAPGSIRNYEFTDAQGNKVIAIWSAERAGSDMSPRMADFEFVTGTPGDQATIYDPITSVTQKITATPTHRGLLVKALGVPDYPLFITLPKTTETAAAKPTSGAGDMPPVSIDKLNWVFFGGDQAPVAGRGSAEVRKLPDGTQLDLAYDFTDGGSYVAAIGSDFSTATADATDIRFSARVESTSRLLLRVEDATGQTFQYTLVDDSPGKWRSYRREITKLMDPNTVGGGPNLVYGGDGKKQFTLPVKKISLGIYNPAGDLQPLRGAVEFRDLEFGR